MKDYALAGFLAIYGLTELLATTLPKWVAPLAALIAAVMVVMDKGKD